MLQTASHSAKAKKEFYSKALIVADPSCCPKLIDLLYDTNQSFLGVLNFVTSGMWLKKPTDDSVSDPLALKGVKVTAKTVEYCAEVFVFLPLTSTSRW